MIYVLCFEPHLKIAATIKDIGMEKIINSSLIHASSIEFSLFGDGIDSSKILPRVGVNSLMIGIVGESGRITILEKLIEHEIKLIEIKSKRDIRIDIELLTNKKSNLILSPHQPHGLEQGSLLDEIEKLNKYDVLIIPGTTDYDLILDICEICSENMVNFYFDYNDHYDVQIFETRPFLVSLSMKQISNIMNENANESNIFFLMERMTDFGVENIIIISNNTIFLKMKTQIFSVFCDGFSEMNKTINKEMLISSFIALMSSTNNAKKAIYEAISIVRDYVFNISSTLLYKTGEKINELFKKISTKEVKRDFSNNDDKKNIFMDLYVYPNTKELVFVISENHINEKFTRDHLIDLISKFFDSNEIRWRVGGDNIYFHIKIYTNKLPINDTNKLEEIVSKSKNELLKNISIVISGLF